ncbi:FAD-binding domain-containing protein [Amniculicola lignicola CBS 123094]|uniref:FAD-binding domain-containing protein n=1 Tax=Amniculicola lignicola CBS 123094 TaxID=1392246 RepID=A0A6A5VXM7_9PLEO|nr:FAD-binding domain-containing protein [Amniculicola lignicola CBS 123094]
MFLPLLVSLFGIANVLAVNFPWEEIQLTDAETQDYPEIRFGNDKNDPPARACRFIPGDDEWPSDQAWAKFNETLGGVLLKPLPLASVCYTGPNFNSTRLCREQHTCANDPTSIHSLWPSGNTCVPTSNPNETCSQGGFPVYVVDARTVRHVQLAVNFARHSNIRVVIKNSGHDFNGRTMGGHSLSIWVHNLRSTTYFPEYVHSASGYTGKAVAYAGGTTTADVSPLMSSNDAAIFVAGGQTVGIAGGFLQTGGHSPYTSLYGLAADRVLSIQAVTADGRYVTANKEENADLFWAFRGGGGGTYGVITSVVVQAFPIPISAQGSITFSTVGSSAVSVETFWKGVKAYWSYCVAICEAGGLGYNFIRHATSGSATGFTFQTTITLYERTEAEYRNITQPLLQELNDLGIKRHTSPSMPHSILDPSPNTPSLHPRAPGDLVGNTLMGSRFFTRANHASPSALEEMNNAIRHFVEDGGYTFHGINHAPTLEAASFANNSVHPVHRSTIMHAEGYAGDAWWSGQAPVLTPSERTAAHNRLQEYMQGWRDITPGGGGYLNEGDAQEPGWKEGHFGDNYDKLRGVRRAYDPWEVFYVVGGVGSDEWEIRDTNGVGRTGLVSQDGRLCRRG